jgi:poly(hydroxyalkanoate) depolymerase family esterase
MPLNLSAMTEATRLTREGKLTEAAGLLQGLLGGTTPPPPSRTPPRPAAAGPAPRILDIDPETGEVAAPPAATAGRLRGLLDGLAAKLPGGLPGTSRPTTTEPLPAGARFLSLSHSGSAGTRGYRLYVPASLAAAPALLVMLHGCTQSPEDFAAGTRMNALAEKHGFLVAYPGQTQAANAQKCWNWFNAADQGRDRGEPALIAGIVRDVLREHGADPKRVFVAGLSAGGAAAAIMGQTYPELFAGVGVHSGLACGAARDMPGAFAAMRQGGAGQPGRPVPTIVFHADRDTTVHPRNGEQVMAQAAAPGLRATTARGQVPGGHAFTRTTHADAAGRVVQEQWLVHGGGHAWSGGNSAGSYTDARGPDASAEMVRFFLAL